MNNELTKEDVIAIAARRAAVSDQPLWEASTDWHWDVGIYSAWAEGRAHFTTSGDATEDEMKAALALAEADAAFIAHAPTDIDALLAAYERLKEVMTWLGKGKMRPLEKRYQAFLHHDAEHGDDDTPPDYVERLEQIAMGDIHLVDRRDGE